MPAIVSDECERAKPKFLEQVRTVLRTRHYSLRTEEAYLGWIRRFILFHGKRHPREMGGPEVAAATQNQHVKASLTCRGSAKTGGCITCMS